MSSTNNSAWDIVSRVKINDSVTCVSTQQATQPVPQCGRRNVACFTDVKLAKEKATASNSLFWNQAHYIVRVNAVFLFFHN